MSGRMTQRKYAEAGKCERCGKKRRTSATLCSNCLTGHNAITASLKEKLLTEGRCVWCGAKHKSGLRTCDPCRESYNARRREKRS